MHNIKKYVITYVFLIFFNCYCEYISGALYSIFTFLAPTNIILLKIINIKIKTLKIKNVQKQLKASKNILKMI